MEPSSDSTEPAVPAASARELEPQPGAPAAAARETPVAAGGYGPRERSSVWLLSIAWLLLSALAAVALAWIAVQLHTAGFAPVVLMPLLTGVAVAASIEGLGRLTEVPLTRRWLAVAFVGGLLVVGAESYLGYRRYLVDYEALLQSNPKMELFRGGDERTSPASFGRFMKIRIAESPILWPVDAALTVAAALGWTLLRLGSAAAGQPEAGRQEAGRTVGKG